MRYKDFAPTGFDRSGAFLPDRQDWVVGPVSITRDSGPLSLSNWECAIKILEESCGEEGEDNGWEIHRFGHWGPGWFEIILSEPGSRATDTLAEIQEALEDYPVLDETDYSEREFEEACNAWEWTDMGERIKILGRHGLSIFASRRNEIPQGLPYWDDFYCPTD